METEAYTLGTLDAGINYGLSKEAWAKAVVPLAAAALGAAAAPEGEGTQGAAAAGLTALGVQSAALAGARGIKGAFTPKPAAPVMRPAGVDPAALEAKMHEINQFRSRAAIPPSKPTQMAQTIPSITKETKETSRMTGTDPAMVTAMHAAGPAGTQMRTTPHPSPAHMNATLGAVNAPTPPKPPLTGPDADLANFHNTRHAAYDLLAGFKIAVDVGMSLPIAGGVGASLKDQRERLPGMSRWVPRSSIERGFDYVDENTDPADVAEQEASRGTIGHPLLGAALAAAGARKFLPRSGLAGPLLAGLGGLGLGTLYNKATKDRRVEEGLEAYQGAARERERFPIQRHPSQTANESTPLAVSRGDGGA